MIRFGRYDVFDKWSIVRRSWAGEAIDVGLDRHGRPLLPQWQSAAFRGGHRHSWDYLRLKREALSRDVSNTVPVSEDESGEVHGELSGLLQEIGYDEIWSRTRKLIGTIQSSGDIASFSDLPRNLIDRLKEVFKFGALLTLRWTEDIGEIPDIEILRAEAQLGGRPSFPRRAIKGKRNVLAMFCVRFYGVLDVIHIYDACPDQVTLVDLDAECLDVAQQIYPPDWTYANADYKDFLRQAEERGVEYDLIVADPWRSQCPEVGFDMFPTIMGRCRDTVVMHYVKEMFNELGVAPNDLDGLSRAISRRTGVNVVATEMVERSIENCWLAMRKAP